LVERLHEFGDSALEEYRLDRWKVGFLLNLTNIGQRDADTPVQERLLPETACKDFPLVGSGNKNAGIGPEMLVRAALVGGADLAYRVLRDAAVVFLLKNLSFAVNGCMKMGAERVHAAYANPVKATGYLIGIFIKFTAGMEDGHHHFQRAAAFLRVYACRDAAAVILNRN